MQQVMHVLACLTKTMLTMTLAYTCPQYWGEQKVVITDESMDVSQLLGGARAVPKVYAYADRYLHVSYLLTAP